MNQKKVTLVIGCTTVLYAGAVARLENKRISEWFEPQRTEIYWRKIEVGKPDSTLKTGIISDPSRSPDTMKLKRICGKDTLLPVTDSTTSIMLIKQ